MKPLSIFITIGIMCLAIPSIAQTEQDVEHVTFCKLVAYEKYINAKVKVEVDFGDPRKPRSKNYILDESGNPKEFNSVVDSINYMVQSGWEFVQAFVEITNDFSTTYYLFKKKTE